MKSTQKQETLVTCQARAVFGFVLLLVFCLAPFWVAWVQAQDADQDLAAAEKAYAEQTLRVGVWLDRSEDEVYRKGDTQTASFQTNEDAFAVVYRIDTEGLVTILWPRSRLDDGFIFGGHEYVLPASEGSRLRVSSQVGEGFVEAIVSRYPFDLRDLEIDFHHEDADTRFDFRVVGDPFLAMNEVNFAVTGLEDSSEFVVTNYVSYFVHQKVDHPRFLCGQCHFDDPVAYHPYQTHCSLYISYDYGWYNRWYFRYGYYPVYYYPAFTYYDPWCWRPWVNFWYDPWYAFPQVNIYVWPSTVYVWSDSPYYVGNSTVRYKDGDRIYRPLNVGARRAAPSRTSLDFIRTNTLVNPDGPGARDLEAMRTRRPLAERPQALAERGGQTLVQGQDPRLQGEARQPRVQAGMESGSSSARRGGLQIRDDRNPISVDKPALRHSAAGGGREAALKPVTPSPDGSPNRALGNRTIRSQGPADSQNSGAVGDQPDRANGSRTIKPVEPRKKGTRIWNSNSAAQSQAERQDRVPEPKQSQSPRSDRSGSARTQGQPANPQRESTPAPAPRSQGGQVKEQPRSSNSGGGARDSKAGQGGGGSQSSVRSRSTQPAPSSPATRSPGSSSGAARSNNSGRSSGSRSKGAGTDGR